LVRLFLHGPSTLLEWAFDRKCVETYFH